MTELPSGWTESTLGEIGEYLNGRGFKKTEWRKTGRPIIRIQNLTGTSGTFNYFDGEPEEHYIARPGDLLVSWAATLDVFVWSGPEAVVNQHIFKVRSFIDRTFHRYLLLSVLDELRRQTHGSGMVHITKSRFANVSVLVPPIVEQERIVAAIEEELSRLDVGVTALKRVRQNLNRMRAAVLHRATSGPALPNCDRSPFGEVLREPLRNGHSAKADPLGTVPVLTLTAVTLGDFSDRNMKMTAADPRRIRDLWIQPGDILIERSNTRELVGTARLYRGPSNAAVYPDLIIRARVKDSVLPKYAELVLQSPDSRRYFQQCAQGISGTMPKIDQGVIERLPFPVPPLSVQAAIVADTERWTTVLDVLEGALALAEQRVSSLHFSILAAAFSGLLVPQDPKDEPASVLLECIAAEHVSSNGHKPVRTTQLKASNLGPGDTELHERRTGIQLMWEDGYSKAEIAETMEISPTQVGSEMTRMRHQGWNLPKRRRKATA